MGRTPAPQTIYVYMGFRLMTMTRGLLWPYTADGATRLYTQLLWLHTKMRPLLAISCLLLAHLVYEGAGHECGHIPPERVSYVALFCMLYTQLQPRQRLNICLSFATCSLMHFCILRVLYIGSWATALVLICVLYSTLYPLQGRLHFHDQFPNKERRNRASTHSDRASVLRRRFRSVSQSSSHVT